ncbi:T9SS type A sorting domain-containing protein, partial [Klebsiella pneumoniae]|uniref:T9SS type A sorting domain-containing protein n=1 Tax=Klebsiella pneumoniae TaxID=573 RepID=UPI003F29F4AA
GSFVVEMDHVNNAEVTIYNVYGQLIIRRAMSSGKMEVKDLDLEAGIYMLNVNDGELNQTIRMQVVNE